MSQDYSMLMPFARWNPVRGVWETSQSATCGHSVPFSATWPRSGSMRNGEVFVHPVWERPIDVSEYSSSLGLKLLGTPLATENLVGRPQRVETGGFQDLADQVAYLEQSSSKAASEDSQGQIMWDFS